MPVAAGRRLQGQRQHGRGSELRLRCAVVARVQWVVPRTPDGHPDLQGIWTTHTFTPLVRPARYADQEFLTEQEAAELTALLTQDEVESARRGHLRRSATRKRRKRIVQNDPTHYDNALWLATPDLTAAVEQQDLAHLRSAGREDSAGDAGRANARRREKGRRRLRQLREPSATRALHHLVARRSPHAAAALQRRLADRPDSGLLPGAPGVVHRAASDSTDGRPHVSEHLRLWAGDSIGRWEGDTFVVDTTNFTGRTAFQGSSAALHVVERFTRVSADTILYRFTVDDPDTWTGPWSAEIPMIATKGPLYDMPATKGTTAWRTSSAALATPRKRHASLNRKPIPASIDAFSADVTG